MSDDLILSGAGATTVASDELLENARRLQSLTRELSVWHDSVARLAAPHPATQNAETVLIEAGTALDHARSLAGDLARGLIDAAEQYAMAERGVSSMLQ